MPNNATKQRIITAESLEPLTASDVEFINRTLSFIPSCDATYSLDKSGITLQISALDFSAFKRRVAQIDHAGKTAAHDGSIPPNALSLLDVLVEKIGQIRSYGIKGKKRLYAGYADERKVKNRKAKVESRCRYYYALDNDFSDQNTDPDPALLNRVLCADSEDALKQYPDNSIDLVVTSPPYNFGLDYTDKQDSAHWASYFEKLFAIFGQCIRILKFGGRIAVNVQPLFSDYIPSHHIISNYFMSKKLIWKGEILWEKNNYNCKYTAWGSWRSPSNPYLKYTWEFIEIFSKGTLKKIGRKEDADITGDEFKKWVVSKWSIAPERDMAKYGHPAMFPEELINRLIKLFSFRGDIVLDPFNGVGTTTLVAKKLGRRYVGIDVSQSYCETAQRRISQVLL